MLTAALLALALVASGCCCCDVVGRRLIPPFNAPAPVAATVCTAPAAFLALTDQLLFTSGCDGNGVRLTVNSADDTEANRAPLPAGLLPTLEAQSTERGTP